MAYQLERVPEGQDNRPGWGRWRVLADAGYQVGVLVEHHVFTGSEWGPATYLVAHNPTGAPGQALWSGEGYDTVPAALAALADHLAT